MDRILKLKRVDADLLFPGDAAAVADRFRELAKTWHPDRNRDPRAADVFGRIVELHQAALGRLGRRAGGERCFTTREGRTFRLRWLTRRTFEAGELFVGERHVVHLVAPNAADLACNAALRAFRFADERMRAEMERFLPRRVTLLDTAEGFAFVHSKRPDQVLLADLLRLGPVDPLHAAWLTTRLLNLACWLHFSGLAHGGLGSDFLLVSPERHEVALTGPMLCATAFGAPLAALPERTCALLPRLALTGTCADARIDPELVRLTVREALGDPAGTRLAADRAVPRPFADWLLLPSAGDAQADYAGWEKAREASFGPRRFVKWSFDPAAILAA